MELFKLWGNILIKNDEAINSLHNTQKDAQKTAQRFADMASSGSGAGRELNAAFKTVQNVLGDFGIKLSDSQVLMGTWAVAGVAAVAAITDKLFDLTKAVADYGDNIDKMSQKLGLSTEAYQKWDYVIGMAGGDIDSMAAGFKTMTSTLADAQNGSASAIQKFTDLGITIEDINSLSQEEMFEKLVYTMQGMEDATQKASAATDLFGKSGQNMIPLLNQTEEATRELLDQTEQYGLIMSEDSVAASATFGDTLSLIQQSLQATGRALGEEMMPYFQSFLDWVIEHMPQIQNIATTVFSAIGTAIELLTPVFELLGTVVGGLLDIFSTTFSGIASFLTPIISTIERTINGLIDVLNTLSLGLLDLDHIGSSSSRAWDEWDRQHGINQYANGGVVTSVKSVVGESGPEILDLSGSMPTITPISNSTVYGATGGNVYNVQIDASSVREFNDIVRMSQEAQRRQRMGEVI